MTSHQLPYGWEIKELGDCFELSSGTTKPSDILPNKIGENRVPVFGGNGIMGYSALKMGDGSKLVIGRVGEKCGCVHKVEGPHWITDNALYTRNWKIKCDLNFFYYLLEHVNLNKRKNKGGQPLISQRVIYNLRLPIPSEPEQTLIAQKLSLWDHAIVRTQELISKKKLFRQGLIQQFLTGRRRLSGFDGEWREVRLGDIFTNRRESNRNDLPMISITADRGVVSRDAVDRKDSSSEDKSKYLRICPGDIGYNTMRMWQGVSGLSSLEGIVSPAYTIITPKAGNDGEFMAILFKFEPIVHLFYRYSQGLVSDTWNLKFNHFSEIKVIIPEEDEQRAIAGLFRKIDRELDLLRLKADALREQKKGLMQQLLTGKIRVKV